MSQSVLLAPRQWQAFEIQADDVVRITVVDGQQVPDIVLFNLGDLTERLSPTNTQLLNGAYVITTGHLLYSNRARALMRVSEATVDEGVIVGGSCSAPLNYARFGIRDTPNCRTNLLAAGVPYGLEEPDVQHIYCPFMTIKRAQTGAFVIDLPKSEAGDFVELQAVVPTLMLLSNCPQERTPTNAFNPTRLHVWVGSDEEQRANLNEILNDHEDARPLVAGDIGGRDG
jgi:uncharacterized protein YcgI (DUF1989 family)